MLQPEILANISNTILHIKGIYLNMGDNLKIIFFSYICELLENV
jgi:hypothetical protein